MSGLIEDGCILTSASAFTGLLHIVLVEGNDENLALLTCNCKVTEKGILWPMSTEVDQLFRVKMRVEVVNNGSFVQSKQGFLGKGYSIIFYHS